MKTSKINIPLLIVGILLTVVGFTLFVLSLYKFDVWAVLLFMTLFAVGIFMTVMQLAKPISQKLKEKNIEYIKQIKTAIESNSTSSSDKYKTGDFKFCNNCGAFNDSDAKFCKECGNAFNISDKT